MMSILTYFGLLPMEVLQTHVLPLLDDLSCILLRCAYRQQNIPQTHLLLLEALKINNLAVFQWLETFNIMVSDNTLLPLSNVKNPMLLNHLVINYRPQLIATFSSPHMEYTGDNTSLISAIEQTVRLTNFIKSSGCNPLILTIGRRYRDILVNNKATYFHMSVTKDNVAYVQYMINQGIAFCPEDITNALSRSAVNIAKILRHHLLMSDNQWDQICSFAGYSYLMSKDYLLTATPHVIEVAFQGAVLAADIDVMNFLYVHRKEVMPAYPITVNSIATIEWLVAHDLTVDVTQTLQFILFRSSEYYKIIQWLVQRNYNLDAFFDYLLNYVIIATECRKLFDMGAHPTLDLAFSTKLCQRNGEDNVDTVLLLLEYLWQRDDRPRSDILLNWSGNHGINDDILRWLLSKGYQIPSDFCDRLESSSIDARILAIEHGAYYYDYTLAYVKESAHKQWLAINTYKLCGKVLVRGREHQYR